MTQIEVRSVRQVIEVRGTTTHQVTVQTQPRQSVVVTGSGQRGPQGIQGATGQPGKDGAATIPPILDGGNF